MYNAFQCSIKMSVQKNIIFKWRKIENSSGHSPKARHGHRAITIKNMMLIFGGGNDGIIDEFHVYMPYENKWIWPKMTGDIPLGVAAFGMTNNVTNVFLFGGMLEFGRYSASLYELKLNNWEWKKIIPFVEKNQESPCARLGHSFVMHTSGQQIFLFGGMFNQNEDDPLNHNPKYLNDLYVLDIGKGSSNYKWSIPVTKGHSPSPRESHTAIMHKHQTTGHDWMLIYGGMDNNRLGDVWILDLNTMSWSSPQITGIAPAPRSLHTANVVNNQMYIFGGWTLMDKSINNPTDSTDSESNKMKECWKCSNTLAILNLDHLNWITPKIDESDVSDSIPKPRAGHSSTLIGSRLYIWSGRDGYRKSWNNQVCCRDLWYVDLDVPTSPKNLQLIKSTFDSLLLTVDPDINTERYLVQIKRISQVAHKTQSIPNIKQSPLLPQSIATATSSSNQQPTNHPITTSTNQVVIGKKIVVKIFDKKNGKFTETPVECFPEIKQVLERNNGKITPQELLVMVKNHLASKNTANSTTTAAATASTSTSASVNTNKSSTTTTLLPTPLPPTSSLSSTNNMNTKIDENENRRDSIDKTKSLETTKIPQSDGPDDSEMPNTLTTSTTPVIEEIWHDVGLFRKPSFNIEHYFVPKNPEKLTTHNRVDKEYDSTQFKQVKLEPATRYKIRVAGFNAQGLGSWCEGPILGHFQTCAAHLPPAPSNVQIYRVSEGIHISWHNSTSSNSSNEIIEQSVFMAVDKEKVPNKNELQDQPFLKVYEGKQNHCIISEQLIKMANIQSEPKPAIIFRIASQNRHGYGPGTQIRWLFEELGIPETLT
ncbi:host cell factor 2-like [Dermatophagoides pteronyssinus]|uniref:host cell factor 2-like n=1 Tax=Dermatophagoides pteronyssinus TaxID=6956 RepID=UPI003F67101B